jgi:hypothetical protein
MDPRRLLLGCALLAFAPALPAQAVQRLQVAPLDVPALPPGAQVREQRLQAAVSPRVRQWVAAEADRQRALPLPDAAAIAATARTGFPGATDADVDALVFMVLMAVARDADQDLHVQMDAMRAMNEQKRAQREAARQMRAQQEAQRGQARDEYAARQAIAPAPVSRVDARATAPLAKGQAPELADADGAIGDVGEEVSLKLQQQQERRQRVFATLSSLMKKFADTEAGISANLK